MLRFVWARKTSKEDMGGSLQEIKSLMQVSEIGIGCLDELHLLTRLFACG